MAELLISITEFKFKIGHRNFKVIRTEDGVKPHIVVNCKSVVVNTQFTAAFIS